MSTPAQSFDPRRFRSTVPYYARYRLGYPDSLVLRAAALAGLRPGDAVMDLGCGPGLLAVPLARQSRAMAGRVKINYFFSQTRHRPLYAGNPVCFARTENGSPGQAGR